MDILNHFSEDVLEYTKERIEDYQLIDIEKAIGVSIGEELRKYILQYGYLAYGHIEFFGVNSKQFLRSDLVRESQYLHEYFPKTKQFIALESKGDGDYALVDSYDRVFEFITDDESLRDTGLRLFAYILSRFEEIKDL